MECKCSTSPLCLVMVAKVIGWSLCCKTHSKRPITINWATLSVKCQPPPPCTENFAYKSLFKNNEPGQNIAVIICNLCLEKKSVLYRNCQCCCRTKNIAKTTSICAARPVVFLFFYIFCLVFTISNIHCKYRDPLEVSSQYCSDTIDNQH